MQKKINLLLLTILFVLFSLSTLVLAVDCPIPDTGQTKCYDADGNEINCPSSGQPFYGQDAQYSCNPQSYTSLAGGSMVQDNVTGLVWENKTDDGSIHDKDDTYNWDDAQSIFIANLNSQNYGGYSDWRLPTLMELSFLVDRNRYDPSINTTYFTNTELSIYWSSTPSVCVFDVWYVFFKYGNISSYFKSSNYYVRAVRAGMCGAFGNFIDNGDSTVTNTDTGLMWELKTDDGGNRDKDNIYNWEEALSYCESLDLAGYDDWRLPNINELQLLVDYTKCSPSINTTFFPDTLSAFYWSSTTLAGTPTLAWGIAFGNGYMGDSSKLCHDCNYFVRAVRGGQGGSSDTSTTTTVASDTTTIPSSTTSTISGSTTTTVQPCPTEEIYGEHSEETELLRYLRDNVLSKSPEGQELIRLYYEWSPAIVKAMEEDKAFKQKVEEVLDGIMFLIKGEVE